MRLFFLSFLFTVGNSGRFSQGMPAEADWRYLRSLLHPCCVWNFCPALPSWRWFWPAVMVSLMCACLQHRHMSFFFSSPRLDTESSILRLSIEGKGRKSLSDSRSNLLAPLSGALSDHSQLSSCARGPCHLKHDLPHADTLYGCKDLLLAKMRVRFQSRA